MIEPEDQAQPLIEITLGTRIARRYCAVVAAKIGVQRYRVAGDGCRARRDDRKQQRGEGHDGHTIPSGLGPGNLLYRAGQGSARP